MRVIPVIDLRHGQAVHAVAGDRERYGPVTSVLTEDTSPLGLASAFAAAGSRELYVADLDAILDDRPQFPLWRELAQSASSLWLDAGLRDAAHVRQLHDAAGPLPGQLRWVVGLESLCGPSQLKPLLDLLGQDQAIFSLDQRGSQLLTSSPDTADAWPTKAEELASLVVEAGYRCLIVLDLAAVGRAAGVSGEPLCARLHDQYPDLELVAGGGVRDRLDLERLAGAGCSAALVATALHRGTLKLE